MTRSFDELAERVVRFRDEREWRPYHNLKDLAVSIALEAAELLELCQWQGREEIEARLADPDYHAAVGREMADVLILLLSAADATGIDLHAATLSKIEENAEKYPVEKARGNAKKYDQL